MNPEAQRTAIAKACGWIRYGHPEQLIGRPKGYGFHDGPCLDLPDYPNDLNDMREAEMTLWRSEAYDALAGAYIMELHRVCNSAAHYAEVATAAQRAEAFLKTLNLWTDGP